MGIQNILNIITTDEIIAGAIVGSIIIPSLIFIVAKFWQAVFKQIPKRKLLGDFNDNNLLSKIYLKELVDTNKSNTYLHKLPDYDPPKTSNHYSQGINIPNVYAKCDVECMNDFINIMGSVGKTKNIQLSSVEKQWNQWDNPIVSIGGHFVTDKIFEKCKPIFCKKTNDSFKLKNMKEPVKCYGKDYGLIMKTKNIEHNFDVFVLMGLGVRGTSASGFFFRKYHNYIAKLYGSRAFALILKCELNQGKEDAKLFNYYPEPPLYKKILHPLIWKKFKNK
ncbi:MAG: hypothetical protein KKF89_01985 [Nanoarchaeota archaeon]|nr:hypothetical protein [Nanoarchaeota archaeon]